MIVEDGEAVARFELVENIARENGQARDVDLVTGGENDLIDVDGFAVAQLGFEISVWCFLATCKLGFGPEVDAIVSETRCQPRFEFQSTFGPQAMVNRIFLRLRQTPKPVRIVGNVVGEFIHPGPVGNVETRELRAGVRDGSQRPRARTARGR